MAYSFCGFSAQPHMMTFSFEVIRPADFPRLFQGVSSKGWSMHVPSEVVGEVGKSVALPCTFTHPHKMYDQALTAIWRVKEPFNGLVIFKCVTQNSSDLCRVTVGSKNRYKLLGNPRQNNLSLQIENLNWNDTNRYFCRVEFSGDVHDKYESRLGIHLRLVGVSSKGWSMHVPSEVVGEVGKSVALPCTFTHPHKMYDKALTAIWRMKEPFNGSVMFKCVTQSSSDLCRVTVGSKNRYKLLGNPRQNNLSLQIENLNWNDTNRYFCRVEFSGDVHDKYESRLGIHLRLIAAPRIINISVQARQNHDFHAKCTAEGEPLPILMWAGPLSGNATSVSSTGHLITKELQHLSHDGKYTCVATNSHGRAEGTVYLYKFKAGSGSWIMILFYVALGIKFVALLVILGIGAFYKGDNRGKNLHTKTSIGESTP
ncbi:sialic acid-binding Ig-like lectin 15 isoform X3 [Pantherophis guttatus]|uniref:Sialic acid-binding Ig-like lectin 15 isoform X3 n=1 Tax=Pantherophis guttatus TaxID=94885 RepID=A0ABM3ZEH0_PANGU|nr:sialic acid-binding Ig-like lectin 15 isoform X3 [Pantherophis guttatus]